MATVIFAQRATKDVEAIERYIGQDSVYYAERFVDEMLAYIQNLANHLLMGRAVPEFANTVYSFRENRFKEYRIVYQLTNNNEEITVLAIVHGRRDFFSAFDPILP